MPWNIKKFVHNKLDSVNFTHNLKYVEPWSKSKWSHTDISRLVEGKVGCQVRARVKQRLESGFVGGPRLLVNLPQYIKNTTSAQPITSLHWLNHVFRAIHDHVFNCVCLPPFQLWVAYAPCGSQHKDAVQLTLEQIELIQRLTKYYPQQLQLVKTPDGENCLKLSLFFAQNVCLPFQILSGHTNRDEWGA